MSALGVRRLRVLGLSGLAVALSSFGGSVLVIGLPGVAAEFSAPVSDLTRLGTVLSIGAVGALPLAALADRFGRRRALALAVAGYSVAALLSGVAPSLGWLALGRLAGVCFEALAVGVATALVVEEMPAHRRGLAVSFLTLAAGAGFGASTLGYPLVAPHWRLLYLAAALGIAAALPVWLALPESRVWQRAAAPTAESWHSVLGALLEQPFRRRLGLLAAYGALYSLFFEPAALFVVLLGSQALRMSPAELSSLVVASGAAGAGSFAVGGWVADRYGRRRPGIALSLATAVVAALTFVSANRGGYWAANVAWSALASATSPVVGAWFAELFPTRARATCEAAVAVATACGAVAGLQLISALDPVLGLGPAIAACSLAAVGGVGLLALLPETRGLPLPE